MLSHHGQGVNVACWRREGERGLRAWARSILIGLCTAALGFLVILVDGDPNIKLSFERNVGLPWLFKMRGPLPSPPEAAVIGLNSESGRSLDLPSLPREWPRSVHGQLLDQLVGRDAAAVVFDYDFSRQKDVVDDGLFGEAIAASDRAVLLQRLIGRQVPVYLADGEIGSWLWLEEAASPVEALARGARGMGPFPLPKEGQAVYEFWTFKSSAGDAPTTSAIALQLVALAWYEDWRALLAKAGATGLDALPAHAAAVTAAQDMSEMMRLQRRAFLSDPGLATRVAALVAGHDIPAEGRRAILALAALYAGPELRYLNFYGPPGTILTYPYEALLPSGYRGKRPPAEGSLAGRVVFAGYSDLFHPEQPDRYYTVFTNTGNGVDLSGVEIMATAFVNLLSDRTLHRPPNDLLAALVVLFGILVATAVHALPATVGVPLALLAGGAYAAGAQWLFNEKAVWLPMATPLLVQLPFALLVGLTSQYLIERRKVRTIGEALEMYVPESVVRDLTGAGVDANSLNQVVYGTCLANDMSGFSTVSEGRSPKELARFMNAYFDAMAQPLKRHGVDVTEFHADTIMCAWTKEQESPPRRRECILGAIGVLEAMTAFNEAEGVALAARIGLQDGNFYLGHTGGGGRMAYSILGDPANTASRLEGLNKFLRTQILAAESVVEGVDGILLRPVGSFQLVGKAGGTPTVQVLGTLVSATPAQVALCEAFAAAMALYGQGGWAEALAAFEAILARHPDDGPSAVYAGICRDNLAAGAPAESPAPLIMTSK